MDHTLEELLAAVAGGRLAASEAADRLRRFGYSAVGDYARLDVSRAARKGVPEVVYAEGKTVEQLVGIVRRFLEHSPLVLCSRVSAEQAVALAGNVPGTVEHDERSRVVVIRRTHEPPVPERGAVGVLAAGTSDLGVAGEAVTMCRAMGVAVVSAFDVGVAGLHRLGTPLDEMRAAGVAAIVVAAGMEGALPSVVAGLVDVPVIGLPTSTGYGLGGRGEAALLGMLQSCSPGLVVVNIDNGIGAGATAALIARRAAS
ncbi:MAG TPA: nickel pincer cofactor biosynthesis protein LarB [Thermoleophilia bacterium]